MLDCVYPCPCGYHSDSQEPCTCAPALVTKYQKRISGPLLGRIDIHIEVPRVDYEKLRADRVGDSPESIRARVQAARDIQSKCFLNNGSSDIVCNADMRVGEIRKFCQLQDESQRLMRAAMTQLNLSAYPEAGTEDSRFSGMCGNSMSTFGGGPTISSEVDVRIISNLKF